MTYNRRQLTTTSEPEHNGEVTQTAAATSTPHRSARRPENPTGFEAKCRAVTEAMKRIGTRLRIALAADGNAEPFLIHARYEINSRMHVYRQAETETAITDALKATGSTCREFLDEAAETGQRLATPRTPLPVVWDEPTLVIAGIAAGTVVQWRQRRDKGNDPLGAGP